MHRSRLAGFIIDCRTPDIDSAAAFWGAALGLPARAIENHEEDNYRHLATAPDELHIEVQQVDHESRAHLDIETDDMEAEVARLERLGARRIRQVRTWWVMEAPTGHRFCVVGPQRGPLGKGANCWR